MEIIIKKPIKKPKSTYRLFIKSMHGDAAAFTCDEFDFTDINKLTETVAVLTDLKHIKNPSTYSNFLEDKGLNWDDWCDYFIGDATHQGYTAPIQEISVNYFDENGTEYTTEVKK